MGGSNTRYLISYALCYSTKGEGEHFSPTVVAGAAAIIPFSFFCRRQLSSIDSGRQSEEEEGTLGDNKCTGNSIHYANGPREEGERSESIRGTKVSGKHLKGQERRWPFCFFES